MSILAIKGNTEGNPLTPEDQDQRRRDAKARSRKGRGGKVTTPPEGSDLFPRFFGEMSILATASNPLTTEDQNQRRRNAKARSRRGGGGKVRSDGSDIFSLIADDRREGARVRCEEIAITRAAAAVQQQASLRRARLTTILLAANAALAGRGRRDKWDAETLRLTQALMGYLVFGFEAAEDASALELAKADYANLNNQLRETIVGSVHFYFAMSILCSNKHNEEMFGQSMKWYEASATEAARVHNKPRPTATKA